VRGNRFGAARFEGKQAILWGLAHSLQNLTFGSDNRVNPVAGANAVAVWPTLWQQRRLLQAAGFEPRALRHVLCTNLSPCLSLPLSLCFAFPVGYCDPGTGEDWWFRSEEAFLFEAEFDY